MTFGKSPTCARNISIYGAKELCPGYDVTKQAPIGSFVNKGVW